MQAAGVCTLLAPSRTVLLGCTAPVRSCSTSTDCPAATCLPPCPACVCLPATSPCLCLLACACHACVCLPAPAMPRAFTQLQHQVLQQGARHLPPRPAQGNAAPLPRAAARWEQARGRLAAAAVHARAAAVLLADATQVSVPAAAALAPARHLRKHTRVPAQTPSPTPRLLYSTSWR